MIKLFIIVTIFIISQNTAFAGNYATCIIDVLPGSKN